ncbi:MAG: T9SS type A sorting domain-containing protein, partial [Cyclobacteriaceae bacterium]
AIVSLEEMKVDDITIVPASCPGTCDGRVALAISGGSGTYTVLWDNGQVGSSLSALCPGNYTYTITDVADQACSVTGMVTLDQFENLEVQLVGITKPTCLKGADGRIDINIAGGSGVYSYEWNDGSNNKSIRDLTAGTYTVIVEDQVLSCSVVAEFIVEDPEGISIGGVEILQPGCSGGNDGTITLSIENAPGALITWANGEIGARLSEISAGTYPFSVLSSEGCTYRDSITVTEREQLIVSETISANTCNRSCDGSIVLNISGGTAPYFILWENGSRSNTLANLCAGEYTYTVSDFFNCDVTKTVTVEEPDKILIEASILNNVSCFGGTDGAIALSVTGGDGTYSYLWDNDETTTVQTNLPAGDYSVTVTDGNGCENTAAFAIAEPTGLTTLSNEVVNPSCPQATDGSIAVMSSGGTAPYSYRWSDDDQIDAAERSDLSSGTYSVTITDSNDCVITRVFELRDPEGLEIVNIETKNPACFQSNEGAISFRAIGGSEPYEILWEDGATGVDRNDLMAGTYSVSIADAKGCVITQNFTLREPEELMITGVDDLSIICAGGEVRLMPDTDWSSYSWSGPDGFVSTAKEIDVGIAGDYTLTTTDSKGCTASTTAIVEVGDNLLRANFLQISEDFVFEPLVFVDVSFPTPEFSEWLLPDDPNIILNQENEGSIELLFTETGEYRIGIRAVSGTCESERFKTIVIREKTGRQINEEEATQELIFTDVYPNPATDQITFRVAVSDRSPVDLVLMDNLMGRKIRSDREEGSLDYLITWDVSNLKAGIYQLFIHHKGNIINKRILIRK